MDDNPQSPAIKTVHAEAPTPTPTTPIPSDHHEDTCDFPTEFRVSGPPPPSSSNLFSPSPSMEEDGMIYVQDFGYMSTRCPSPPSDVDELNPSDVLPNNYPNHPVYDDEDDIEILNEDRLNLRDHQTPPRDAHSPGTLFKQHNRE
uniref:Uncharacterized protein n=1 Tax=Oryza punctata TaxID=4537 RepID=A0A0E0M677_ORYPU